MANRPPKPEFDLGSELQFEEYSPQLRLLKPELRSDAKIIPQSFGGKTYYVLQDPVTLQFFRVAETEHEVLGQLSGKTTLGEIHNQLLVKYRGQAPSFRDLTQFIFMLRHANLLVPEAGEQTQWTVERARKKRREMLKQKVSNFMYVTIPLLDPDRFLRAALPYVRWVFTRTFFVVWLFTILAALVTFFYHFDELTAPANGILAPANLMYLWISFAIIKTCHEFGHAFAARYYGAEVHRMGLMFLIFMPCWYVDATPVWAFRRKWPKILVGCGGMFTELFLAALCLFAWLALEPSVLRTILYNAIFVASVSTVLFNGNPLLRYDAYYVLADLVEIPNLRQNARQYIGYLLRRYLIGEKLPTMAKPRREKVWYLIYGPCSLAYTVLVVIGIVTMIASRFFFVGVAIAVLVGAMWIATPVVKTIGYIFFSKTTQAVRARAVAVFLVIVGLLSFFLGIMPVSNAVRTPCAVEPREQRRLHAEWGGFLTDVFVQDGDSVKKGQVLAQARNEDLEYSITRQRARIRESEARLNTLRTQSPAAADAEAYRLEQLRKDLGVLIQRNESLTLRAPFDGEVIAPNLARIKGVFLNPGDSPMIVASLDRLRVTAVVDSANIAAIRAAKDCTVRIKFKSAPSQVYSATVERVHPSATNEIPPLALTSAGGGQVLLDPRSPDGSRTLAPWTAVNMELDPDQGRPPTGVSGTARFIVSRDPVAVQVWMRFLRMLNRRFLI